MKANIYVQGTHWATIDIPPHSVLGLLAQGILTHYLRVAHHLEHTMLHLDGVQCQISLRVKELAGPPDPAPH